MRGCDNALSATSLRAKRSNPKSLRSENLDCFVALLLAMTWIHFLVPAAGFARVLRKPCPLQIRGRRECRVFVAPAALRAIVESTQASHHRYAETVRHSLRDGVTASFVLSPECRA